MHWYCVYTDRARERLVAEAIRQEAHQTAYLPMEQVVRVVRGVRRSESRPLIPRHLFFGTHRPDSSTFEAVRDIRGVRRILSLRSDGSPSPMREGDIEIIAEVAAQLQAKFEHRWRRQDVFDRRLDDTEQVVERLREAAPDDRAGILYDLMGRGKKARLRLADLQQIVHHDLQPAA